MNDVNAEKIGKCRCEKTQFEVTSPPLITMACHCTGCQRMTASAFSLSGLYANSGLNVVLGEPVIGGLHGDTRHYFCPHCMSWIFTRPYGMDDLVNVRATLFDDAQSFIPFIESYTCEKLPWATTPAVHSFEKFPSANDFSKLLAEFSKR